MPAKQLFTILSEERDRILALERRHDWDGEDALPISRESCEAAIGFLENVYVNQLLPPQSISPSIYGAIGFQWKRSEALFSVQVEALGENGCVVRQAGRIGRGMKRCDVSQALQELARFIIPGARAT